jgi:hypothetical protein
MANTIKLTFRPCFLGRDITIWYDIPPIFDQISGQAKLTECRYGEIRC